MTTVNPLQPIVLVDDEAHALFAAETTLLSGGFDNVRPVSDSRALLSVLRAEPASLLFLDLTMPFLSGEELLGLVAREFPETPVIVLTATDDVETAVRCMRRGATDYLVKPVHAERLLATVVRTLELRQLRNENASLKSSLLADRLEHPAAFEAIVTRSPVMHALLRYVEAIARTDHPVLILGETGTGKELIAQAVHAASGRSGPFVPVNVAGVDDNVFSDTLFGHVRGAFTGAERVRQGLIQRAAQGTLFLDEIGDLSLVSQVKLLRVLQEREYSPVGADAPQRATARVVVATHRDLEAAMIDGRVRSDLYYRLAAHRVSVPPLRQRPEDIPLLAEHFAREASDSLGGQPRTFAAHALELLSRFAFPGNVRQLRLLTFDVVAMVKTPTITHQDLGRLLPDLMRGEGSPRSEAAPPAGVVFPRRLPTVKECTALLVEEALRRSGGNQTLAARLLGVTQPALSKRLKRKANEPD